ncbi:cytochrome P450 [Ascobolus immersus RN42]|uniref:Cytochrome P450 n=1 Tax=Ascobolus immersus RN42 TaxID=1160509 RepID=A0A3N4I9X1_ASCIM|nr:cytochrome P450 [Ascobolus immersus RN42]
MPNLISKDALYGLEHFIQLRALFNHISTQTTAFGVALSFAIVFYFVYYILLHPLAHIPGPFFSKFSDIPYLLRFLSGYEYKHDYALFQRYGPVVRVGPNRVAVGEPEHVATVYNKNAWKGDNYNLSQNYGIFGIKSAKDHAERKKMLTHPFLPVAVKSYDPIIQRNVDYFLDALQQTYATRKGEPAKIFDFLQWPAFFSYDTLTELAFGEPMGFVQEQRDIGDMYQSFETALYPIGAMIRVPSVFKFLKFTGIHDMMAPKPTDGNGVGVILSFADTMIQKRIDNPSDKPDILNKYLSSKYLLENRDILFKELLLLIVAGTDTVAITIRAILSNVLNDSRVNSHLLSLTPGSPGYRTYVSACIKETLRLSPPGQMPFARVTPPHGHHFGDVLVPGGFQVYPSFYTINRCTRIWGPDANVFRPERWLGHLNGSEVWSHEKLRIMDLSFGVGPRMCLGKPVAETELQLVIEGLWERFEFDGSHLDKIENVKVFNQMRFGSMPLGVRLRERI